VPGYGLFHIGAGSVISVAVIGARKATEASVASSAGLSSPAREHYRTRVGGARSGRLVISTNRSSSIYRVDAASIRPRSVSAKRAGREELARAKQPDTRKAADVVVHYDPKEPYNAVRTQRWPTPSPSGRRARVFARRAILLGHVRERAADLLRPLTAGSRQRSGRVVPISSNAYRARRVRSRRCRRRSLRPAIGFDAERL